MASWETTNIATDFNVADTFNKAIDQRNRGGVITGDTISLQPFGDDSVVGINATAIPNIKSKLEAYITEIETVLKKFEDNVNARQGVAGDDVNTAITNYFVNVKKYLLDLVTNFRAFNDKLSAVDAAYLKFQGGQQQAINTSAGEISSTTYTEQYQGADPATSGPGPVATPSTNTTM